MFALAPASGHGELHGDALGEHSRPASAP